MLDKLSRIALQSTRKNSLVLFMGRAQGHFIDNVKYAFLYCSQNIQDLSCVFLSFHPSETKNLKDNGLPAVSLTDRGAHELMLKTGMVVCDDFGWKKDPIASILLHPAKVIQLWHGIPLKAIGFPEIESQVNMNPAKAEKLKSYYSGYQAVVSTSKYFTRNAFSRCFKSQEYVECGYPRNDILLRPMTKPDMINVDQALYTELIRHRKTGGKVVMYMPTFRDTGGDPFSDRALHIPELDEFAQKHNLYFLIKMHPYLTINSVELPARVKIIDAQSDAYPILRQCDILVTDYSSIYFDFLLLDRPIIFYPYDYQEYVTQNRELLFDYDKMTPGMRVKNEQELMDTLKQILDDEHDDYAEERNSLANLAFEHKDGKAAKRFGEFIWQTAQK